jgi:hypothetical protein
VIIVKGDDIRMHHEYQEIARQLKVKLMLIDILEIQRYIVIGRVCLVLEL